MGARETKPAPAETRLPSRTEAQILAQRRYVVGSTVEYKPADYSIREMHGDASGRETTPTYRVRFITAAKK